MDRPLHAGDRVTLYRRDFIRTQRQMLLVEQVVPYRSLHFRDLSPAATRLNVTATLSVEAATDREVTWVEEAIFYSLGRGRVLQWLDRWVLNPLIQPVMSYQAKAFRRLQAILAQPHAESIQASGPEGHNGPLLS